MGIRTDQVMGLNERARKLVKGEAVFVCTEIVTRKYPDGRIVVLDPRDVYESSVKKEKSGRTYEGMFDNTYPLYKYTLPDGQVYYEGVQSESWSSGPVIHLALQYENGEWVRESLWTETEIDRDLGSNP